MDDDIFLAHRNGAQLPFPPFNIDCYAPVDSLHSDVYIYM